MSRDTRYPDTDDLGIDTSVDWRPQSMMRHNDDDDNDGDDDDDLDPYGNRCVIHFHFASTG